MSRFKGDTFKFPDEVQVNVKDEDIAKLDALIVTNKDKK